MAVPLDQYCAELEQSGIRADDKVLTEDPTVVFKSIQEEKKRQQKVENELEPSQKKSRTDSGSLPNVVPDEKQKVEGELEDGEVPDNDRIEVFEN